MSRTSIHTSSERRATCKTDAWFRSSEEDHSAGEWAAETASSDCFDSYCCSSLRYTMCLSLSHFSRCFHLLRTPTECFFLFSCFIFHRVLGLVESPNEPASPGISLSHPLPALTSTPRHVAPPPPPPPPPLPCPSIFTGSKERKDEKDLDKGHQRTKGSENKGMPSMLDVLKDLNHVKLRSVKR